MKEMEQKNYDRATMLMPLFTQDTRLLNNLVGGYTGFPDQPYYDNNYFLMYHFDTVKDMIDTENRLEQNEYFSKTIDVRIDGIWYTIAIFTIPNDIKMQYDLIKECGFEHANTSYIKKFMTLFDPKEVNIDELLVRGDVSRDIPETQFDEIVIEFPED